MRQRIAASEVQAPSFMSAFVRKKARWKERHKLLLLSSSEYGSCSFVARSSHPSSSISVLVLKGLSLERSVFFPKT